MRKILSVLIVIVLSFSCQTDKTPESGVWKGEGILFTVDDKGETIIELEVLIPHNDEFLAQWYEDLEIIDNTFSSFQEGNSYLGIPERNLEGEFISSKLAKGTFNDVKWEAKPE